MTTKDRSELQINGERLWDRLMEMAQIGATAKGGVCRVALTDKDKAGHDAVYVSRVAPTSMIFVPREHGLSHNELENAKKEELEAGANVLLHAMLAMASA